MIEHSKMMMMTRLMLVTGAFESAPLVAQPLIYENTQAYDFLNYRAWEDHPALIIAAAAGFIEIQTPVLHSGFLQWFLSHVVARMLLPSYILVRLMIVLMMMMMMMIFFLFDCYV
jgi:hypothetical protein